MIFRVVLDNLGVRGKALPVYDPAGPCFLILDTDAISKEHELDTLSGGRII